jgi:hypothetical protein
MSDQLKAAVRALQAERADVRDRLWAIDRALDALTGLTAGGGASGMRRRNGESVYSRVVELISQSDQDWSVSELVESFRRQGMPLTVKDPMNAVRSALSRANSNGAIMRTSEGRYGCVTRVYPVKVLEMVGLARVDTIHEEPL